MTYTVAFAKITLCSGYTRHLSPLYYLAGEGSCPSAKVSSLAISYFCKSNRLKSNLSIRNSFNRRTALSRLFLRPFLFPPTTYSARYFKNIHS